MHRHLVTVEIRVESRTHQRMKLNGLAFNQHRFKRLNAQAMQRRCAVQDNRIFTHNLIQGIPDFGCFLFHHLLGAFHRGDISLFQQSVVNKRFKELDGHFLRQAALMQSQIRSHRNHRTTGIVNPFAQQVLAETSLFPFQHIG